MLDTPTHIYDFVISNSSRHPNKPAIMFGDSTITWAELAQTMHQVAANLQHQIGKPTEQLVIAVAAPNSIEFIALYLGILQLGHLVMPIDIGYKELEVRSICSQIQPAVVVYGDEYKHLFKNVEIACLNDKALLAKTEHSYNMAGQLRQPAEEQLATLLFTSGTTGTPKAVPATHANHLWNITASSPLWSWTESDRLLLSLPLSHWYGLVMGLAGAIYHGNTIVLQSHFNAHDTLARLSVGDITFFTHVSPAYIKMSQTDPGHTYDLSNVRVCISGAAPLPPTAWHQFKERFGVEIIEAYGSSETGRIASNSLSERTPGSPGRPLPGVQLRLGEHHELQIKTPGLFPGYYKNPAATQQKLTDDGWWKLGDIAELKDGRVTLKGRTQERIVKYGYSLHPRDIEWALLQMPGIQEVHVVGIPHAEEMSDELVYMVAGSASEATIIAYCKENMPSAWRPDRIVIVDSLPKTSSGKPKVRVIKALASERHS